VLPLIAAERLSPEHELVCLVHTGAELDDPARLAAAAPEVAWREDGTVSVAWPGGDVVLVPPC